MLEMRISQSIDELPKKEWDILCANSNPFASCHWLYFLEKTINNYSPYYVHLYDNSNLKYGVIFYKQTQFQAVSQQSNILKKAIVATTMKFSSPLSFTLPTFAEPGLIHNYKTVPFAHMLSELSPVMKDLTKQFKSRLCTLYPISSRDNTQHIYSNFISKSVLSDAVLDIDCLTYQQFEAKLNRKNRAEVRRVRNRSAEAGVEIKQISLHETDAMTIQHLMKNIFTKHNAEYFLHDNVIENARQILFPNDYAHLIATQHGDTIGTLTIFRSGENAMLRWAGLDYQKTADNFAYHYLMSESIKVAIGMGVRHYKLGGTVLRLKKKLGATIQQRVVLLKWNNPVLNAITRRAIHGFN